MIVLGFCNLYSHMLRRGNYQMLLSEVVRLLEDVGFLTQSSSVGKS